MHENRIPPAGGVRDRGARLPASLHAADAALVYNKNYQCGKEIIQVSRCRRDSDTPDLPPTADADNFCQVYYLDRPNNGIGGTAFVIELRSELEERLGRCGALGGSQTAVRPAAKDKAGPATLTKEAPGAADAGTINQIGWAHAELGNADAAVASFKEALRLKPGEPVYYSNLALTYASMDKFDDAGLVSDSDSLRKIDAK